MFLSEHLYLCIIHNAFHDGLIIRKYCGGHILEVRFAEVVMLPH